MKIAISDACIFIDLIELELTPPFFELKLEIHTSYNVINELNIVQQNILYNYKSDKKLHIHNISEHDNLRITETNYPLSLSLSDQTVLFLAESLNAVILSSDKTIRHNAKIRSIEYHGMLWILDRLVEEKLITTDLATKKLNKMIQTNMIYQNNKELMVEMEKRIKKWR